MQDEKKIERKEISSDATSDETLSDIESNETSETHQTEDTSPTPSPDGQFDERNSENVKDSPGPM